MRYPLHSSIFKKAKAVGLLLVVLGIVIATTGVRTFTEEVTLASILLGFALFIIASTAIIVGCRYLRDGRYKDSYGIFVDSAGYLTAISPFEATDIEHVSNLIIKSSKFVILGTVKVKIIDKGYAVPEVTEYRIRVELKQALFSEIAKHRRDYKHVHSESNSEISNSRKRRVV